MRSLRIGLIVVGVLQAVIGAWQLFLPRSFFDDFPLPAHPWVALLPPYNVHLMVDTGAQNLAMAAMLGIAAVLMRRPVVLTGYLIFNVAHFVFHVTHLEHFPAGDALAQTVATALWLVVVVALLVGATRLPGDTVISSPGDRRRIRRSAPG